MNPANGFLDELKRCITLPCSALYISGYPDDGEENDESAEVFMQDLTNAGIKIESVSVLDSRNPGDAEIRGEAYEIKDGTIRQIASDGEIVLI